MVLIFIFFQFTIGQFKYRSIYKQSLVLHIPLSLRTQKAEKGKKKRKRKNQVTERNQYPVASASCFTRVSSVVLPETTST